MTSKLITLPKTSINGVTRAVLTDLETRFQQFQDHIKSANPDIDIDETLKGLLQYWVEKIK